MRGNDPEQNQIKTMKISNPYYETELDDNSIASGDDIKEIASNLMTVDQFETWCGSEDNAGITYGDTVSTVAQKLNDWIKSNP